MRAKGTILESCPFCGRQAIVMNPQGVAVCTTHRDAYLELKCICGQPLDLMKGKYGIFGNCLRCGNVSLKKALDINDTLKAAPTQNAYKSTSESQSSKPAEKVVRSDELDFM